MVSRQSNRHLSYMTKARERVRSTDRAQIPTDHQPFSPHPAGSVLAATEPIRMTAETQRCPLTLWPHGVGRPVGTHSRNAPPSWREEVPSSLQQPPEMASGPPRSSSSRASPHSSPANTLSPKVMLFPQLSLGFATTCKS